MPTAAFQLLAMFVVDPLTAIFSLVTCLSVGAAVGLAFASRYRQQYLAAARQLASLGAGHFPDSVPTMGIPRVSASTTTTPPATAAPSPTATAAPPPTGSAPSAVERERNTLRQERDELLARNRELKRQLEAEFEKAVAHRDNRRTIEQLRHEQDALRKQIIHKDTQYATLTQSRDETDRKLQQSHEHIEQLRLFLGQQEARVASLERERDAFRTRAEICEQQRR